MKIVHPKSLNSHTLLATLFHSCGKVLFEAQEFLTSEQISDMIRAGIQEVFILGDYDNIFQFMSHCQTKTIHIDELTPTEELHFPLFSSTGKLLFGSSCSLNYQECIQAKKAGIDYVVVKKTHEEMDLASYQKFLKRLEKRKTKKRQKFFLFS